MTMKMTLTELMGCNKWSKAELLDTIDDLGRKISERDKLIRDLWKAHDCGARCAMYEQCDYPHGDRCLMYERIRELEIEVER